MADEMEPLLAMGFSREQAAAALKDNDMDGLRALDALLTAADYVEVGPTSGAASSSSGETALTKTSGMLQLADMGFSREQAAPALEANGFNVPRAVNALLAVEDVVTIDLTDLGPSKVEGDASKVNGVARLTAMGFSCEQANAALEANGFDVEASIEALLAVPSAPPKMQELQEHDAKQQLNEHGSVSQPEIDPELETQQHAEFLTDLDRLLVQMPPQRMKEPHLLAAQASGQGCEQKLLEEQSNGTESGSSLDQPPPVSAPADQTRVTVCFLLELRKGKHFCVSCEDAEILRVAANLRQEALQAFAGVSRTDNLEEADHTKLKSVPAWQTQHFTLASVSEGQHCGLQAVGVGPNKKNRARAADLALVLAAIDRNPSALPAMSHSLQQFVRDTKVNTLALHTAFESGMVNMTTVSRLADRCRQKEGRANDKMSQCSPNKKVFSDSSCGNSVPILGQWQSKKRASTWQIPARQTAKARRLAPKKVADTRLEDWAPSNIGMTQRQPKKQYGGRRLAGNLATLAPSQICFTHDTISARFRSGMSVDEAIDQVACGGMDFVEFPPVVCFRRDGKIWSLGNRRLFVARVLEHLGKLAKIHVDLVWFGHQVVQQEKHGKPKWFRSFSTFNGGSSVGVRSKYKDMQMPQERIAGTAAAAGEAFDAMPSAPSCSSTCM